MPGSAHRTISENTKKLLFSIIVNVLHVQTETVVRQLSSLIYSKFRSPFCAQCKDEKEGRCWDSILKIFLFSWSRICTFSLPGPGLFLLLNRESREMGFLDYSNRSRMTKKYFRIFFCFVPNRLRLAIFPFMYICIFSSCAAKNFCKCRINKFCDLSFIFIVQ